MKKLENFSLQKIPIKTGNVINIKVLTENVNNCKSKLSLYKKWEKKFKYSGTVIKENNAIDILKIDNEGEELKTVSSINKNHWKYIKSVSVDGFNVCEYIPSNFINTKVGSAQRFYKA